MIEHDGLKYVDAGVVPNRFAVLEPALGAKLVELCVTGFLDDFFQAEFVVEKVDAALADILAGRDGDESGEVAFAESGDHLLVRVRAHEDVAVGQQKGVISDKLSGQFRCLAGAVLHLLCGVGNVQPKR